MKTSILLFVLALLVLVSYSKTQYPVFPSNPLELNLGNDTTICTGESLPLDAGPGYDSYLWQDGSMEQTYLVTEEGTYWVEVWLETVMYADTITVSNWSKPYPYLGEDRTMCFGETIILETGNYVSYLWQDGSTSSIYFVSQSGDYWVTVTDFHGCNGSDTVVVDAVIPFVDLGNDTVICECGSLLLDPGSVFEAYIWQDGSVNNSFFIDGEMFGVGSHYFSVTVADSNYCIGFDDINVYISEHQNVIHANKVDLKLFPNPCKDIINIDVKDFPNESYLIEIIDLTGRVVYFDKINRTKSQNEIRLDVSNIKSGFYNIQISSKTIKLQRKLLIQ